MLCPKCGNQIHAGAYACDHCGYILNNPGNADVVNPASQIPPQSYASPVYQPPVAPAKQENILTGTIGALIGAAIGALSIILLSQLNIVAAFSGLILAVCTLKGYELLGGKLSTIGIVICVVFMLVTPYFADRLDWAIMLMNELPDWGLSLGDAFGLIPVLLEADAIEASTYWGNLALLYVFVLIGGFSTVCTSFKRKK